MKIVVMQNKTERKWKKEEQEDKGMNMDKGPLTKKYREKKGKCGARFVWG